MNFFVWGNYEGPVRVQARVRSVFLFLPRLFSSIMALKSHLKLDAYHIACQSRPEAAGPNAINYLNLKLGLPKDRLQTLFNHNIQPMNNPLWFRTTIRNSQIRS